MCRIIMYLFHKLSSTDMGYNIGKHDSCNHMLFLCVFWKRNHRVQKLINFPVFFPAIGSIGWLISFLIEISFIFTIKDKTGIVFRDALISTLNSFVLSTLFIFTLSFFLLKTLNRYVFLPKLFPRGHIQELEKVVFYQ